MNYVANGYVRSGYVRQDSDTQGSCTFDKYGKFIYVSESVNSISLVDMYSRWVDWSVLEENAKKKPAMKYSGFDAIPTGFTGATFFVINGWRVIYNTATTAISGVLYSEDYDTGYWDINFNPIYPVTVSAVVNTIIGGSGVTAQDKADIISGVWANVNRTLTEAMGGLTTEQHDKLMITSTKQDVINASQL